MSNVTNPWTVGENYYNIDTTQGQIVLCVAIILIFILIVIWRPKL